MIFEVAIGTNSVAIGRLSLGFGSKASGKGMGFSCVVKGSGGLTRPDPIELGKLTTTGPQPEDEQDNSVILNCPTLEQAKRVVGGRVAETNEFPWMVVSLNTMSRIQYFYKTNLAALFEPRILSLQCIWGATRIQYAN